MDMNQERLKLKMENGVYILEVEKKNYSYQAGSFLKREY